MSERPDRWDAVIVNHNGALFLDACLRALSRVDPGPARLVVVDNASSDDSLQELTAWPQAEVIESARNLGYAGGANLGISHSDASICVVLNPDVELDPDYGEALLKSFGDDAMLGAAGAILRFPDGGGIQHAGGVVHWPALTTSHRGEGAAEAAEVDIDTEPDYVTGAAIALRRSAWEAVQGFDEAFFPAYWEDVDLCWRLREAGWKVTVTPKLSGVHHEGAGAERGPDYFRFWTRNRLRFAARHMKPDIWWGEFVPAEIQRLRGELSAVSDENWYARSGAVSLENAARLGISANADTRTIGDPRQLLEAIETVRELPEAADPRPRPLGPSDGVLRRLKRFLARFSGRLYAEELYWQQREFNERLVRALEAQDRLNREIVVQLLFSLLLSVRLPEHPGDQPHADRRHDHELFPKTRSDPDPGDGTSSS